MTKKRKVLLLLLVGVALLTVLLLQIPVTFSFRTTGMIYPLRSWNIRTDPDGNFISELKNHSSDIFESFTAYRFERGDVVHLKINPVLNHHTLVKRGDTIGYLHSTLLEEKIRSLEHQLAIEKRILETGTTGQKPEIVENARQRLRLAQQQLDIVEKNFRRIEELFQAGLISTEEYETAENAYEQARINVLIAQSQYHEVLTGLKPEEVQVIRERIRSLENELEFLTQNRQKYVLISPLEGRLVTHPARPQFNEFITVADTTGLILMAPVKVQYASYLPEIQTIEIPVQGFSHSIQATPIQISGQIEWIGNQQVILVKAVFENTGPSFYTRQLISCRFVGQRITLKEFLKRTVDIYFM